MPNSSITLKVSEHSQHFIKRLHLDKKNIDKQPAGLNFYEKHFKSGQRPTIQIEHDQYSFDIPFALSFLGTENVDYLERGISSFDINSGFANYFEPIHHDKAKTLFMNRVQKLLALGWQQYIHYGDPRLKGKDSYRFIAEGEEVIYGPDPSYIPTLEEWMTLDTDHTWTLYVDGLFLNIGFRRDRKRMDPDKPGAYLINYEVYGKEEHAENQFMGEDRKKWRELWVEDMKQSKRLRYEIEAELKTKGYTIDTSYKDPIIHPEDPVEP
ncbi:hypothetical protein H0A36_14565 [Endozoicomonas sp. SM1973]|uniref:Uncharacterized protein n=1 Tax=Spartinivicinus marinus TaxID=2994442 RepID=A0A853I9A0_9GAMM|nr:hypothetical protein [Spartinivicinus marinus]MCX4028571.1 hypothetical protein [Spartinivicinus marinus]NYZ67238.1 hypothetical protein [Spartinivicinus marinus]